MVFQPKPGLIIRIGDLDYKVTEHPFAKGMSYGQEGRRAVVYKLVTEEDDHVALKVFKARFRIPGMVRIAELLDPYASLSGLQACQRTVLTGSRHPVLLSEYTDLTYAVLMPWVEGPTWQEMLLDPQELTPERSLKLARAFSRQLMGLEEKRLAHCDLSGANLIIQPEDKPALVDLEEMYGPEFVKPQELPAGSPGYAHKSAPGGIWSDETDRFAGAVLLVEMLCWHDPALRKAAWGESYFAPKDMQTKNKRLEVLRSSLETYYEKRVLELFDQAWGSDSLRDCPTFAEWSVSLRKDFFVSDDIVISGVDEEGDDTKYSQEALKAVEAGDLQKGLELYKKAIALASPELSREIEKRIADLDQQLLEKEKKPVQPDLNEYSERSCSICGKTIPAGQEICPHCEGVKPPPAEPKRNKRGFVIGGVVGGGILIALMYLLFGRVGVPGIPEETITQTPAITATAKPDPTETSLPDDQQTPTVEDFSSDQPLITLDLDGAEIYDIRLSPDKKTIAIGTDKGIYLFNVESLQEEGYLYLNQPATNLIWSSDSQYIISGTSTHTTASIYVWNLNTDQSGFVTGDEVSFREQVQWPEDDPLIAFNFGEGISLWNTQTWERTRNLVHEEGKMIRKGQVMDYGLFVNTFMWLPDKTKIAVSYGSPGVTLSGALIIWDANNGSKLSIIEETKEQILDLVLTDDGSILVGANPWDTIKFFDMHSYLHANTINTSLEIRSMDLTNDNQYLVSGSKYGYVNLWDRNRGNKVESYFENTIAIEDVVWLPTNRVMILSEDRTIKIWKPDFSIVDRIGELESLIGRLDYAVGISKTSPIDEMVQVFIPAGFFEKGSKEEGVNNPIQLVYQDAFWMDQTEVTADQFQQFMEDTDYSADPCHNGNHPVACVSWSDAQAYCDWAGRRLPTNAEWMMPAILGVVNKEKPWGTGFPEKEFVCKPGGEFGAQVLFCPGTTAPVGYYASDMFGLYDMAGNVSEWVDGWFDEEFEYDSFVENPQGPDSGNYRMSNGPHWQVDGFRADVTWTHDPNETSISLGFRCAESYQED